jgi:hypothetical protein
VSLSVCVCLSTCQVCAAVRAEGVAELAAARRQAALELSEAAHEAARQVGEAQAAAAARVRAAEREAAAAVDEAQAECVPQPAATHHRGGGDRERLGGCFACPAVGGSGP